MTSSTIDSSTIDLDRIVLDDGTEITEPPVITDAEGKIVDNEATAELQAQLKAWAEVAYRIVEAGDLSEEDSKALRSAYAELPAVPGKNFARSHAEEQTRDALSDASDPEGAFRVASMWSKIGKDQKEDTPKPRVQRQARPQVTPTEMATAKLATMKLAAAWYEANAIDLAEEQGDEVDEDFAVEAESKVDDLAEMLESYIEWLDMEVEDGEEKPDFEEHYGEDVNPIVRDAAQIARRKPRRGRSRGGGFAHSGPRRNTGNHITEAFSQVEVGTFLTVAEIVNLRSEEYGDDKPSSGAVANRLFPPSGAECTIEGIEPGVNDDGRQGATKIA